MSRVLVVNSGSSSLKYQLIEMAGETVLARGLIERIGEQSSSETSVIVPDHAAAFRVMLESLRDQVVGPTESIAAVGHRVVHGGERFVVPTIVTDEVKKTIEELSVLAPLHNPPNLAGIIAAETTFPGVPQVAVFDTAFHRTLPPVAHTYAINATIAREHDIRRFGFHGISFQYVSAAAATFLQRPLDELKLIVLHLGNGASACAIDRGRSIETSMGMTPLEGLMMGTRGGDIDPGIILHLQREAGFTVDDVDSLLNHNSGLLGLGGFGDIRDVQASAASGNADAQLAFDVYLHRIRGYIGTYLAQLGWADAIVFTAGVGENNAAVRAGALAGLESFGLRVDQKMNASAERAARVISTEKSTVAVVVVPTNEELEIARQSLAVISHQF